MSKDKRRDEDLSFNERLALLRVERADNDSLMRVISDRDAEILRLTAELSPVRDALQQLKAACGNHRYHESLLEEIRGQYVDETLPEEISIHAAAFYHARALLKGAVHDVFTVAHEIAAMVEPAQPETQEDVSCPTA